MTGDLLRRYEQMAKRDDERRRARDSEAMSSVIQAAQIADPLRAVICRAKGMDEKKIEMHAQGRVSTNISLARERAARREHTAKQDVESEIIRSLNVMESPVEISLLPWLVYANYGEIFETFPVPICFHNSTGPVPKGDLFITPQFKFMGYRADFAICARLKRQVMILAVECDGQEFHHNGRDIPRDGVFASFGIEVVRISGRDARFHPDAAAAKVANKIYEWGLAL